MRKQKILASLLFFALKLSAQNLVCNAGFEVKDTLIRPTYSNTNSLSCGIIGWSSANTKGTPDWFERRASFFGYPGNGDTINEKVRAHSGNNFAGISAYYDLPGNPGREYVQGQLQKTLEAGKVYKFSVFLAMPYYPMSNYRVDSLGVYFSPTLSVFPGASLVRIIRPQITLYTSSFCLNNDEWIEVSGFFRASGGEKYFVFGCFQPRPENESDSVSIHPELPKGYIYTSAQSDGYNTPHSYYFIDDVSLILSSEREMRAFVKFYPGQRLVENNIHFGQGDSALTADSYLILDEILVQMKCQPMLNMEIIGHTDSSGVKDKNQLLSEARARVVKRYFVSNGIASERITTKGYGSSKPISIDQSKNRRVEFIFSDAK